jgi:hypothetical protein
VGEAFKGLPNLLCTDCTADHGTSGSVRRVLEALSEQGYGPGLNDESSTSDAILVLRLAFGREARPASYAANSKLFGISPASPDPIHLIEQRVGGAHSAI